MESAAISEPPDTTARTDVAAQLLVLVVDDSKLQRRIVSLSLQKWGFNVLEADSGQAALDICRTEPIDLIISDWMMPGMDGLEFCKEFRKLKRDRYGYFILVTSKNEKNDVAKGLDIGADDFLSKPVNSAELKARIRAGTRVLDMEQKLIEQNDAVQAALDELQMVYDAVNKDLVEAEKFQQSLVPVRNQLVPGGEVSLLFQSSHHVGGDLVGYFSFAPDRLGLYSLDVSGHGISSALLTARLAGYLSPQNRDQNVAFAKSSEGEYIPRDPAEIASILNDRMIEEMDTEHYFTLCFADICFSTGLVRMVQAGHPHPAIFNTEEGVRYLGSGGPPIGLIPGIPFETVETHIKPGDKLFLYSDGITECQNKNDELLEEEGLQKLLERHIDGSGPEFIADMLWELTSFAEERPFEDDVSAILFEYREKLNE
ncbi:MAG: SpoIIE family protein phosphatase [Pseudomonadota bacterium]